MSNIDLVNKGLSFEVSVLCVPGVSEDLKDNYFVDGRLRDWVDSSIVNLVNRRDNIDGVFAVTTDMDASNQEDNTYVSLVRELDAFRAKYESAGGYLDSKTRVLGEMLEDVENYVHSISLGSNVSRRPSVACLYAQDGFFTASTLGDAVIYRYRDEMLVPLCNISNNTEKVNRLIELGIVAEKEAGMYEASDSSKKLFQLPQDKFKAGDCIVLCSGAASKYLVEDRLELLCTAENTNTALSDMMRGALIEGYEDDLTVMVIKVKGVSNQTMFTDDDGVFTKTKDAGYDDGFVEDYGNKNVKISNLVAGVISSVLCLIIGLVIGCTVLPSVFNADDKPQAVPTQNVENDSAIGHDVTMAPEPKKEEKKEKNEKKKKKKKNDDTSTVVGESTTESDEETSVQEDDSTEQDGDLVITATASDTYWGLANKYCKDTSASTLDAIAKASGKASVDEYIHAGDDIVIPQSLLK